MKVYAVSDLHLSINNPKPMNIFGEVWDNYLNTIEESLSSCTDDDVILIAGDISWAMNLSQAVDDLNYLSRYKGKKVIIRGNHDYWWKSITNVRAELPINTYALQNDCIKLGNLIVCGSRGWSTPEGANQSADDKKIYERELIRVRLSLDSMAKIRSQEDKVVFMIHYPPFNSRFDPSPFTEVFSEFKVDAVVYGHLHGKDGRISLKREILEIPYYLTSCDIIGNKAIQIMEI